ncbi:MAG: long-chain N-acyl amino acid synthase [Pseudomonadota bacterium]
MQLDEAPIASFDLREDMRDLCIGEGQRRAPIEHPIDMQVFHIRMANSRGHREAASLLIRKMYGWRGYAVEPGGAHEANKITLYAETGGKTVGTMSLCLDREVGLPADENFHECLESLRKRGRRLCEPSRLAIDKGVSKRVFASLIHISYIYAHNLHGYTDYVIEVNPRHVMFYKRMLGFVEFGAARPCTRVGAPAVLLRLELDYMGEQIRRYGGLMELHGSERSFYPYFFPGSDEAGITARLSGNGTPAGARRP